MKIIRKIYTSSRRQAERELRRRRRQEMRQAVTAARAAAMESGLSTPEPESEPESEPDPEPIRVVSHHRPRELKYKFTLTGGIFVGHHTWEHLLWCYH